jgi:hypothetical protein
MREASKLHKRLVTSPLSSKGACMTAVMIAFITAVGSQCEYWLFSSNFSDAANKSAAKPINVTLLCADVVMVLSCAVTVAGFKAPAVPLIYF